jgi:hypothetical protein
MYPVGELGDCFLLKFTDGDAESTVLIDCGSFRNSGESIKRMNFIAGDIKANQTIAGDKIKPLDLVVGTHQHNDHLSGFTHAADTFKAIGMDNVWLSWLDNPDDGHAADIANGQRKLSKQLQNISIKLSGIDSLKGAQAAERINDILGFYGLAAAAKEPGSSPVIPQQGINNLKATGKTVSYLNPGKILDLPGLAPGAVKVHVLGPPRDNNLLFDINPGKGESYESELTATLNMADGFLSALSNFTDDSHLTDEPFFPFDIRFEKSIKDDPFLAASYAKPGQEWRKIDADWLGQAERLALYLDSYTNNSSLVLAFELVEAQKVLLFVGDAQTGNWLSWKTVQWEQPGVSLDNLLSKTVLYKVGHHCSHNATLPECLEKMTHPELVAMIPVDKDDPNITKEKGWKMPAANLYQHIKDHTKRRILRMDGFYEPDCNPNRAGATADWGELLKNVDFDTKLIDGETVVTYKIKG